MIKTIKFALILKGILLALMLAMLMSLAFSLLISFTSLPESGLSFNIILGSSVFIAAAITAYQAGAKGLFYGLAVGLGFLLLILVLSSVLWAEQPSLLKISEKAILTLATGSLGGIIGVLIPHS